MRFRALLQTDSNPIPIPPYPDRDSGIGMRNPKRKRDIYLMPLAAFQSQKVCLREPEREASESLLIFQPRAELNPRSGKCRSYRDDGFLRLLNLFVQSHQSQPFLLFIVLAGGDALPVRVNRGHPEILCLRAA